ncbi:hypothetical protein COLO4_08318 [Corchorus olitorius]|uniref:F-box domain-containing protein n=1 Tax=Corchorus olitorius TaxID=93759 RepID=A0A1R3KGA9_9ROSI|nr:hypothetical protein COLO4_08318 [Corchorus olitorius]
MEETRKESKGNHEAGIHIPHDLILKIFESLQAKSVGRCRCVCKLWRSCLTDPEFINRHAMKARENPKKKEKLFWYSSEKNLFYKLDPETYCDLDHDDQSLSLAAGMNNAAEKLALPDKFANEYLWIVGSCNGFLCCLRTYYTTPKALLLLNSVTGESRVLCQFSTDDKSTVVNSRCNYGFGYDASTDDYKIIRFLGSPSVVNVFSLRNNCWRSIYYVLEIGQTRDYYMDVRDHLSVEIGGFLHWQFKSCGDSVFTFDLAQDKCGKLMIDVPNMGKDYEIVGIGVLDGCFYVTREETRRPYQYEIWVMKEYGVAQSWTKLIHLEFKPYDPYYANNSLKVFPTFDYDAKKGRLLLELPNNYRIFYYDFQHDSCYDLSTPEKGFYMLRWSIVTADIETLLSPNSPWLNMKKDV